jgi:Cysteine-rich secretory protein family
MFSKRVSDTSCLLSVLLLLVGLALVARPANAAPDDFYTWAKWRLGHAPYTCQAGAPWVRPNVRRRVPPSWWKRLEAYEPAPCKETTGQPVEPAASEVAEAKLDAREETLRVAVNAERRRRGLAPLPVGARLERAARDHTADMIRYRYLGHDWHNGTPFGTWVNRYTACTAGEIIAWQSPRQTPSNAVRQWLGSPPHRAALLASSWSVMGVELTKQHALVVFGGACRT